MITVDIKKKFPGGKKSTHFWCTGYMASNKREFLYRKVRHIRSLGETFNKAIVYVQYMGKTKTITIPAKDIYTKPITGTFGNHSYCRYSGLCRGIVKKAAKLFNSRMAPDVWIYVTKIKIV